MSDIETIILRFRDMSIFNTIDLHKQIIIDNTDDPFVWWGWWAKPQEKVALEEIKTLSKKITAENPLTIYLFDSGKIKLHEAKCLAIEFSNGDFLPAPDKTRTPDYYSQNEYMMWFKLKEISDNISDIDSKLKEYSYIEINEHFVSHQSPFSMFDQKKIYNAKELFEQQRTIWYIRTAKRTDIDREICSYNPPLESYENRFSINKCRDILWLSDLHFSETHHAFVEKVGCDNKLDNLLNKRISCIGGFTPSRIIASGDFTFSAETSEFKLAEDFFKNLQSIYNVENSCLTFCPGNHDMKYSVNPYKDDDEVVLNFPEAKKNYLSFYVKVKGSQATEDMNSIQRFIIEGGKMIELISLNTCILQQDKKHFKGMGFAGKNQLDGLESELKKSKNLNVFRILIMHHNLLPVTFCEEPKVNPIYSILLDSEAVSQFCINNSVRLILHGHTHKNYFSKITRKDKENQDITYYVIGLGSSGAIQDDLNDGSKNEFAELSLDKDKINAKIYNISPNGDTGDKTPIKDYTIPYEEN